MDRIDRDELDYGQLTALVNGLVDDHTSHTFASVQEWSYVPSPEEIAFYDGIDVKIMMNRGKNQPVPQRVKRPWEEQKIVPFVPSYDPERKARRAKLNEVLGVKLAGPESRTNDALVL